MAIQSGGDIFNREQAEALLYPAKGLPGGGQLEVRMEISADHPDPDIRAVARRVKFFNLESWHKEWTDVAKKNEDVAAGFAQASFQLPTLHRDGFRFCCSPAKRSGVQQFCRRCT